MTTGVNDITCGNVIDIQNIDKLPIYVHSCGSCTYFLNELIMLNRPVDNYSYVRDITTTTPEDTELAILFVHFPTKTFLEIARSAALINSKKLLIRAVDGMFEDMCSKPNLKLLGDEYAYVGPKKITSDTKCMLTMYLYTKLERITDDEKSP